MPTVSGFSHLHFFGPVKQSCEAKPKGSKSGRSSARMQAHIEFADGPLESSCATVIIPSKTKFNSQVQVLGRGELWPSGVLVVRGLFNETQQEFIARDLV